MLTVLLVLQVIVTVSMVVVILIQRNASDGMAGLAGGGNSLISGRASANILTRITSILAAIFLLNSLVMAAITARSTASKKSILDEIQIEQQVPGAPSGGKTVTGGEVVKDADRKPAAGEAPKKSTSKPVVPIAD